MLIAIIRNRPVISFLVIAFGVSYPVGITFNFIASSLVGELPLVGLYLPRLVTVLGPALAAWLVGICGGGVIPVRELVASCRVPARYLPAVIGILAMPLMVTSATFMIAGLAPSQVSAWITSGASVLGIHVMIQCLVIGLGEEIGWRGWLLPSLARQRGFLVATVLTGIAWIAWHGPVFLAGLSIALSFIILLSSLTILFSWLWQRCAGSVGVVAIAHGAVNAPFFFLETAARQNGADASIIARAFLYNAIIFACLALLAVVADRRVWSRSNDPALAETTVPLPAA